MDKIKAFLKRKDIVISGKRYGIDALGAMAQGLFCSLLIGTILDTLGKQLGIEFLVTVGGYSSAMSGAAMAVAIGYALKAPPLVLFSLATVGYAANALGSTTLAGDGKATNTAVNIKIIRLSEIYLIAAEAALHSTKQEAGADAAAGYLNEIRRRSPRLAPATAATITDDMILDERSKELFGEGQRFFDMMRMGRTIEFNDDFQDIPVSHRGKTIDRTFEKIVLPISQDEINANPALENQQNPGY